MYKVTLDGKDLVIRLSTDVFDEDALGRLLNYIEIESIRKKSKLTEEQAAILAKEVDQKVWKILKRRFVEQ